MADTKASALTPVTTLADADSLYVVASSASKRITTANFAIAIGSRLALNEAQSFAAREEQTSGTDGGTFTSGAWQTRTLNTIEEHTSSYVALSTNVLTIPAGKWLVWWSAPGRSCNLHQSRLVVNKAGTPEYHYGSTVLCGSAESVCTLSSGCAIIEQSSSFTVELQHRSQSTRATTGFGEAHGWGTEVYSQMLGLRVGDA